METVDLSLIEAKYSRTQDQTYGSPWCPTPKARLIDYRRAIEHMPEMIEEIKQLRAAAKENS